MDQDLDARIRTRAYAIWEREGRPEGADLDHWLRAVLDLQAEEADDAQRTADAPANGPTRDGMAKDGGRLGNAATQPLDSEAPGFD